MRDLPARAASKAQLVGSDMLRLQRHEGLSGLIPNIARNAVSEYAREVFRPPCCLGLNAVGVDVDISGMPTTDTAIIPQGRSWGCHRRLGKFS